MKDLLRQGVDKITNDVMLHTLNSIFNNSIAIDSKVCDSCRLLCKRKIEVENVESL